MKDIMQAATNKINITGKLVDMTFREGKLSDGRLYESATATIRVNQSYEGHDEVSEIPVSLFAVKYTAQGRQNPGYDQIQKAKELKTAQNVGIDEASVVRVSNATIRENNFMTRSGSLINGWQINTGFINESKGGGVATFALDIFIMDMHQETDREGDPTGRLVIKGGIVQYNGTLDVLEFIVEDPQKVDYIERHWNNNDTVSVYGRVRVTSVEQNSGGHTSSWGEDIPMTSTRTVRELIVTSGDDDAKEDDFAYDPSEIKKAFNVRKAKIEQLQLDVTAKSRPAPAATTTSKYSWE